MTARITRFFAWIVVATSVLTCAAGAQSSFDSNEIRQLDQGGVLVNVRPDPGGAAGLVEAAIEIPVPPRRLWAVMLNCDASMRFIPSLKACRVLSAAADNSSDVREHIVQWIWPLPKVRSVFRSSYTPFEKISFALIDGDLKYLEGMWRLEPVRDGTRTRLTYQARVTPGWPVPDTLVRLALETDIPRTLKALRKEASGRE